MSDISGFFTPATFAKYFETFEDFPQPRGSTLQDSAQTIFIRERKAVITGDDVHFTRVYLTIGGDVVVMDSEEKVANFEKLGTLKAQD